MMKRILRLFRKTQNDNENNDNNNDNDNNDEYEKTMKRSEIKEKLLEYDLKKNDMKELLSHITNYEEHVKMNVKNGLNRKLKMRDLEIRIEYIYDGNIYYIDFEKYINYGYVKWIWRNTDLDDDDDDIHYELGEGICNYLNKNYNKAKLKTKQF